MGRHILRYRPSLNYETLYTSKLGKIENENIFFEDNDIVQMTVEQQDSCSGPVTIEEIKEVLKSTKNNKAPGSDGIPMEFYKVFFNDIWPYLLRSMNESFATGSLSLTQKQGIITCLPKGQKAKHHLKNLRPITLLNCDYKLLSGVLANRMKKVLPSIIGPDQKGFIKGRYIGENT